MTVTGELYGVPIDEVWRRVGSSRQVVGVESSTVTDGADSGGRRIRIVNGALDLEVLPDRGLDLGQVRVAGVPLAWTSPTGFPSFTPTGADPRGWMQAFGGGLLTTCGLLSYGAPSDDEGTQHPLHGRYSSLPAQVVRADADDREVVVEGVVREATVFGEHLELRRRISTAVGSHTIRIDDRITNRGIRAVEPMVLYHLNFGWPLVDEGTQLRSPALRVEPRDDAAARGLSSWARFPAPTTEYPEQVFRHELPSATTVDVDIVSPRGLAARVSFDSAALPSLFQWRVAEQGGHVVLGIEPATAPTILGRASARAGGMLRPLAPGEHRTLGVQLEVTPHR